MRPAAASVLLCLLLGCDRDATPTPPAAAQKKDRNLIVEVRPVTPLLPDRRTHLAPTNTGQYFWLQEAEPGKREFVFAMSEGGLPAATRFSNAAVAEALGQPDITGSIQSLVHGPDKKLYFFFTGGTRRTLAAALGAFSPDTG